jgi:hypothetical protein
LLGLEDVEQTAADGATADDPAQTGACCASREATLAVADFVLVISASRRRPPGARACSLRRGEVWFRPARCCSTGSGRMDLDLMISGPRVNLFYGARVNLFYHPYTRPRALLARQWSLPLLRVARQRDGSHQNNIGSLAAFCRGALSCAVTP